MLVYQTKTWNRSSREVININWKFHAIWMNLLWRASIFYFIYGSPQLLMIDSSLAIFYFINRKFFSEAFTSLHFNKVIPYKSSPFLTDPATDFCFSAKSLFFFLTIIISYINRLFSFVKIIFFSSISFTSYILLSAWSWVWLMRPLFGLIKSELMNMKSNMILALLSGDF